MCKILENVCVQLISHLDRNNLIYPNQFEFQSGKSTEHNLINAVTFIGNAMNGGQFSIGFSLA